MFLISETVSLSSSISFPIFLPSLLGLVLPLVTLSFLVGLPKRTCYAVKVCSCPFCLYPTMHCYEVWCTLLSDAFYIHMICNQKIALLHLFCYCKFCMYFPSLWCCFLSFQPVVPKGTFGRNRTGTQVLTGST